MSLVDQTFNLKSLAFYWHVWLWLISFRKKFDCLGRLSIQLEEEQIQLLFGWVFETSNQVQVFCCVVVAKTLLKFHVESASREGSIKFDCLGHKLFGQLGDILSEPAIQRDSLHVFRGTKHYDEIFLRLNWTVRDGDWHENFVCLCFDQCQQRLQVSDKR